MRKLAFIEELNVKCVLLLCICGELSPLRNEKEKAAVVWV